MNGETLQSYNTRLNVNNESLNNILENINKLPTISGKLEITKNGNYNESPLGVVVTSDTIDMQTILDNY